MISKTAIKFPRNQPPERVFWCWDISYKCNYKCAYCRVDTWRETRYAGVQEWAKIWDKIYDNYGSTHMRFSGGEPFIYPGFIELMGIIGQKHTLNVTTNLSFDVKELIKKAGPIAEKAQLVISSSYHPEYSKLQDFIDKVLYLKNNGIYTSVSMVAWPPFLKDIPAVKEAMEKNNIQFQIIPLGGHFFDKDYPGGYTDEECEFLGTLSVAVSNKASKDMFDFKVKQGDIKTKKRLCRMGMNFGMIRPNGDVFRCCTFEKSAYLGNMIDGTFALLEKPAWCELERCNCYKAMIVGEEEKTNSNWNWARHKTGKYYEPNKRTQDETDAINTELKKRADAAIVMFHSRDVEGAVRLMEETMTEYPDHILTYSFLAEIYIQSKDFSAAKDLLDKAMKFALYEDGKGKIMRLQGYLAYSMGETQKALEYLNQSLKMVEDTQYNYFHLAKTYMMIGDINNALDSIRLAVKLDPGNVPAAELLKDLETDDV